MQRRVLWLATSMVHHANRVRTTASGVKVGGHEASSASLVGIMTALYFEHLRAPDRVSVKPHAAPVLHAINYLLGTLDRSYLTTLREFGGLQSYPSRAKDPGVVDFSTGSVGIGATATLWSAIAQRYVAGHFDVPQGGRHVALVGDAELDEGAIWEALVDPDGRAPRRGALDRRPQPAVARPGRARHGGRPAARDVRGGRLGDDHGQVRAAAARAVRARRRRGAARADRLDEQRGVPAAAAQPRRRAARAAAGRGRRAPRDRAAHRASSTTPRSRPPSPISAGTTSPTCSTPSGAPTSCATARP